MDINVDELGVDMMSLSAHKVYGPKGIGALYVRKGTRFSAQIVGGGHERNKRAGTENVPGIAGFGKACELILRDGRDNRARVAALRDRLVAGILERVEDAHYNGHPENRIPKNASLCFRGCEGEALLLHLDFMGICASSGSACTSLSLEPSHVLAAMGVPIEIAHGVLRLTLGKDNTEQEIGTAIDAVAEVVAKIRRISAAIEI
jgi:cysteine desulfurase